MFAVPKFTAFPEGRLSLSAWDRIEYHIPQFIQRDVGRSGAYTMVTEHRFWCVSLIPNPERALTGGFGPRSGLHAAPSTVTKLFETNP